MGCPQGGDIDEPTLGDRLRMMGGVRAPSAPEQQPQQESGAPVKADSLSVLLTQALRSRDNALLEKCLSGESGVMRGLSFLALRGL